MQSVAGWTGLVAEHQPAGLAGELHDQAPNRLRCVLDVTEEADLAVAPVFGQCHRDLLCRRVETDKDHAILLHGSSPMREARCRPIRCNPRSSHIAGRATVASDHEHTVCQALVSLTLARAEVPVCVALRVFLPRAWAEDAARRTRAGVPEAIVSRPKWQIALDELDRVRVAGASFGCVLADAEYGKAAEFRHGLSERDLTWAVGILPNQKVYPIDVVIAPAPVRATGRPPKHPVPSVKSKSVEAVFASLPEAVWRTVSWRRGTKGDLRAEFAALRVRVADGPVMSGAQHLPGEEAWLVCERRLSGERKYYLANHAEDVPLESLAATLKARWVCEQAHQQMKEELGLDHFEGRSWLGLHHHALMTMIAFAFLQHLRLGGKNHDQPGAAAPAISAAGATPAGDHPESVRAALPTLAPARALPPPTIILAE